MFYPIASKHFYVFIFFNVMSKIHLFSADSYIYAFLCYILRYI